MVPPTRTSKRLNRRSFVIRVSAGAAGWALGAGRGARAHEQPSTRGGRPGEPLFRISLAQWSLHRALERGDLHHLDFPGVARRDYGLEAVEYVSTFFGGRERDQAYLLTLRDRCASEGVRSLLIMCDGEGRLGDPDAAARTAAVQDHYRWVEAARVLDCHSIRVNASSEGTWAEQRDRVADGLRRLAEFADGYGIGVIVENHGGLSSNGRWLSSVIDAGDHSRLGTLPDFGNFRISDSERYDNYRGIEQMMPWARAVSAKSYDFDEAGTETVLDYELLIRIVLDAGYRGWIGIEYEGSRLPEPDGIRLTKALLERVREMLTPEYT
jgi:sugar phosphate isomerase/epimerase